MNPMAMTLIDPASRVRGRLARSVAAVGGLAVLLTDSAAVMTPYASSPTATTLTSIPSSAAGLGISTVTRTVVSAVARTGGER
ncbi:MAG: hypothetical protein ABI083_16620 [Lapillicoccus sp.]